MAAPSSTVGVSTYVQEIASGSCTVFQQIPTVSILCQTLLALEQLVETAKGNRGELVALVELCDVVTRGVLDRCSGGSGLYAGLAALGKHVERAKVVAGLCNRGAVSRFVLSRKIARDIAAVRSDVLAFSTVNNLAITTAIYVSVP